MKGVFFGNVLQKRGLSERAGSVHVLRAVACVSERGDAAHRGFGWLQRIE